MHQDIELVVNVALSLCCHNVDTVLKHKHLRNKRGKATTGRSVEINGSVGYKISSLNR